MWLKLTDYIVIVVMFYDVINGTCYTVTVRQNFGKLTLWHNGKAKMNGFLNANSSALAAIYASEVSYEDRLY